MPSWGARVYRLHHSLSLEVVYISRGILRHGMSRHSDILRIGADLINPRPAQGCAAAAAMRQSETIQLAIADS